jgi:hypothetical protein
MKFSDNFTIKRKKSEDWFDPILSLDTPLFIDPFLIYRQEKGFFKGSHREIIDFFNTQFKLIAQSRGDVRSFPFQKAVMSLRFPEVSELCLGYTSRGTKGSGASIGIGKVIAGAIWEAIQAGINEIRHFEEIALIREGFGADRISDMTGGILRYRLSQYTESVCLRHGITLGIFRYRRGIYNAIQERWDQLEARLPFNRWNKRPILLVPQTYLRQLPTMNADDFWDYCYTNENELLRREFSDDIKKNVDKATIIEFAKQHSDIRKHYQDYIEGEPITPYNLLKDERGYHKWYDASARYCMAHPISTVPKSQDEFLKFVDLMVRAFGHFIEQNQGWKLLWNDNGTPKGERAAQLLFLGIVKHYCHANNLDISPESNIGRGPVDFKVSSGFLYRTLLELKLARNTRFWNGLTAQLPTYMTADEIQYGYFIVVMYTESDFKRVEIVQDIAKQCRKSKGLSISVVIINALPDKLSASKLRSTIKKSALT